MGQGPCHCLSLSFRSEGVKDGERWCDGEEDRGLCFTSEIHRWRVMIMQQQTEDRERGGERNEGRREKGAREVQKIFR